MNIIKRYLFSDGNRLAPAYFVPNGREMQRYMIAAMAGAVFCAALAVHYYGKRILVMSAVAWMAGAAVEMGFAIIRKKPLSGGTPVFALLLVLMLPPQIPLWMVALGSAFGIFFGKEVFGGTGNHIFSPVLLAKGFLIFSYPMIVVGNYFGSMLGFENPDAWIAGSLLILACGGVMIIARPSNIYIIAGILFSATALGLCLSNAGSLPFNTMLEFYVSNGFLLGACILACDPAGSPYDKPGKALYGLLIGALAVLMRCKSNYTEAMLFAVLLGNVFSPVINSLSMMSKGEAKSNEGQ